MPETPQRRKPGRKVVGASWEERNKRITFYCPLDIREQLATEVAKGQRSQSEIINDALRQHLKVTDQA